MVSFCLGFAIELNWNFEYVTETWLILKMRHHMQYPVILPVKASLMTLTCIPDMSKWEFMDFFLFFRFSLRRCQAICWLSLKYWEQNSMSRDCLLIAWDIFLSFLTSWLPPPTPLPSLHIYTYIYISLALGWLSFCSTQDSLLNLASIGHAHWESLFLQVLLKCVTVEKFSTLFYYSI